MIRDITIGQYYPADSVIHKLDPRTKLVGTIGFIVSVFLFHTFAGYAVATIFLAGMILLSKVPETEKAKWGKMIERYLHTSQTLKAVFLLIDIRHDPSANDKLMYDWIVNNGYNPIIIATKLDKLKRSQVQKNIKAIKDGLKLRPGSKIIPFSAETKQGKDEIWALMDELTGAVPAATDELKA